MFFVSSLFLSFSSILGFKPVFHVNNLNKPTYFVLVLFHHLLIWFIATQAPNANGQL